MKVLNATGRFIASPLGAVMLCAAGSFALWYGLERRRAGAPKANPPGERARRSPAASGPDAPGVIAARRRTAPGRTKKVDRREPAIEEVQAEVESPASADRPGPQPGAKAGESIAATTSDSIGPGDPRARDLAEYQARKAAVPEDAAAQKTMALWCDERALWDAAKTHWEAVVRLDPGNEAARRRLGFRLRNRQWAFDASSFEDVAQKKADVHWSRALERSHAQMKCRSNVAVPGRAEAVARVESVGDPHVVAALWRVFAADTSHHGLIVGVLGRFGTREASQMLAALAVYSREEKAQAAAVAALRGREAADYGERLVALMQTPMRIEERQVAVPAGPPARELLVEGDTRNYRFLFSRADAPTSETLVGCFQPRLSGAEIQFARQFNENQAAMAQQALDQQVDLARQMIEKYNDSIRALNQRVARVLNEVGGAGIGSDPEDGRRWLAMALGTSYQPPADRPKPTITEIVAPLYNPTFLPIPVAT